jgi:aminopeptidase N
VYKATFDITLVTEQGLAAISNGKIVSDTPGPGPGQHSVRFATTPKMSSYLVALAVGDFESIEGEADGIPIRVWTTAGKKELGRFALDAAQHSLRFCNQYFEIKYPFGKLDLIEVPDFASGAMENTGAIVFRDSDLLLDSSRASVDQQKEVASTVAHEIAHQWFGDLVTMAWWDDLWLNEGFANWMQNKPIAAWKPEWKVELNDVQDSEKALELDSLASTHPIHQAADTPDRINELFDDISYRKAAAVLLMVENYLGPEVFRSGVNRYLHVHAYGNATSQDFWKALAEVSHQPVENIGASFVTQPGAPVVSLRASCVEHSTNITLTQQRYFGGRELYAAGSKEIWAIPVCMKTGGMQGEAQKQCRLLTARQETFAVPGCAPWVLANAGSTGYYRSAYEPGALREMSRGFETDFDPPERVRLLGDQWASVRSGWQSIADYLRFVEGLRADNNRAVMDELTERLEYIAKYVVTEADRDSYQSWLRNLLEPAARNLDWKPLPGESDDRKVLRTQVLYTLGHAGGDPQVLAEAARLAQQALADPASVDGTLAGTVFALAAENGGSSFYDKIMRRLKETTSPEEYYLLLDTLPRFHDPKLLSRTLRFALTSDVRGQNVPTLIAGVMENSAGQRLAWDFVRGHWTEVRNAVGDFNTINLVKATGSFCEVGLRDQTREFFANHQVPAAERTLRQSLERIDSCVELKSQQAGPLAAWLEQQGASARR